MVRAVMGYTNHVRCVTFKTSEYLQLSNVGRISPLTTSLLSLTVALSCTNEALFLFFYYVLLLHPKGQTINAEYYSSLLVQLQDILKEKRQGVLFLHDNAPAHQPLATQNKLAHLGF